MRKAYNLSLDLGYCEIAPDGSFLTWREDASIPEADMGTVSSWADGLMHKYYIDRANGRCSLAATLSFDVEAFEAEVQKDIAMMAAHVARIGPPRRLDFAEMYSRGYRGAWAGEVSEADTAKAA